MNLSKTMRRAADAAATHPKETFLRQGLRHARLGEAHIPRCPTGRVKQRTFPQALQVFREFAV